MDPTLKQFVCYGLLIHKGRVLVYRRPAGEGDGRLRRKLSLGVGGHFEQQDVDSAGAASVGAVGYAAILREFTEEVRPRGSCGYSFREAGLVNDDDTDVGRVHLGLVYRVHVHTPDLLDPSPELGEVLGWWTPDDVMATLESPDPAVGEFESWSALIAPHLLDRHAGLTHPPAFAVPA